jgi:hypothetical protein
MPPYPDLSPRPPLWHNTAQDSVVQLHLPVLLIFWIVPLPVFPYHVSSMPCFLTTLNGPLFVSINLIVFYKSAGDLIAKIPLFRP